MRRDLWQYAADTNRRPAPDQIGRAIRYASELLFDGERLELRDEPGRELSETEAADAIRAGRVVEVVS